MQDNNPAPTFDDVSALLGSMQAETGAAETHGILSGVICAGQRLNGVAWLDSLSAAINSNGQVDEAGRTRLIHLYESTCEQLRSMDFDFYMLLPDDDTNLDNRAEALSLWCQGFMYGLGIASINESDLQSTDVRESLHHIAEIAELDFENIHASEQDENAYMEVVEYVRMAVLMLYSELTHKEQGGKTTAAHSQLH